MHNTANDGVLWATVFVLVGSVRGLRGNNSSIGWSNCTRTAVFETRQADATPYAKPFVYRYPRSGNHGLRENKFRNGRVFQL